MPKVQLPDGTIEHFPDDMPLGEIEAILQARFPPAEPEPVPQLPEQLDHGETIERQNGAKIVYDEQLDRFCVYGIDGKLAGLRNTLTEALDLADGLKPPPPPRRLPERPKPIQADEPLPDHFWHHEIERCIRRDEARERREQIEAQNQRRFRNRGTAR